MILNVKMYEGGKLLDGLNKEQRDIILKNLQLIKPSASTNATQSSTGLQIA